MSAVGERAPLGVLLRDWRQRRRMSQLDLALEAGVSARHLSFLETGRSKPSREMVLHLAEELDVPLRERNRLLLAAGYAPAFDERPLEDPELEPVRRAVAQVLTGIEPFPAAVIDRWWNLVASNRQLGVFLEGVAPELREPPANVLRVSLHPEGMAPRIANLAEWRAHLLSRLRREIATTGDTRLQELLDEVSAYPVPHDAPPDVPPHGAIAVPLRIATPTGELTFISTVATFGTAVDVTVAELSIEAFFPADPTTAQALTDLLPKRGKYPLDVGT
jgi:transcriptional regulator with XRE-family HTH domain